MKHLIWSIALVGAIGCGLNEDKFGDEFVDKYCTAWTDCEMEGDCPVSASDDDDDAECDFDKTAAKACLDAEFSCGDFGPEIPADCGNVCGGGSSGDDDDDDDDDDA